MFFLQRVKENEWIKEFRTYEYDLAFPSDNEQEPDPEEYNALVQKFESDISSEPEVHQQLWIFGSE